MPIKPENMSRYPGGSTRSAEWRAIRERILDRAGEKCERCGVANGNEIVRQIKRPARVVLTIAHIDQNPGNNDDKNLQALCQRCHNTLDAPFRAANAAETRRRRKAGAL